MAPVFRKKPYLRQLAGWTCAAACLLALGRASLSSAHGLETRDAFGAVHDAERIFIGRPKALTDLSGPGQQKIYDEVFACGISSAGPGCLDTEFERAGFMGSVLEGKHALTVFNVIRHKGTGRSFAIAIELPVDRSARPAGRVTVIALERHLTSEQARDSLSSVDTPAILSASVAAEPKSIAQRALVKAADARGVYHLARYLLANARLDARERDDVLAEIAARADLIARTGTPLYQTALLELLRKTGYGRPNGKTAIVALSTVLLRSQDDGVARLAALLLAQNDAAARGVRERLREIIQDTQAISDRLPALEALIRLRQDAGDENAIVSAMDAVSSELADTAMRAVADFELGAAHLPAIRALAASHSSGARETAVALLARLRAPEARELLLALTDDSLQNVRAAAVRALEGEGVGEDLLPLLKKQLTDGGRTDIRAQAAAWIARLPASLERTQLLLRAAGDRDWEVRVAGVRALAQVEGAKVTATLVDRLGDADREVRVAAERAMDERQLVDADLPALRSLLNASAPASRIQGIAYLRRIETQGSLKQLTQMLDDPTPSVHDAAKNALQGFYPAEVVDAGELVEPKEPRARSSKRVKTGRN